METQSPDDDAFLLTTLGVTSAKPEDIERHVIAEVEQNATKRNQNLEDLEPEQADTINNDEHVRLLSQLKALDKEITAVAASLDLLDQTESERLNDADKIGKEEGKLEGDNKDHVTATHGVVLQRALATDRLKSLKKKRKELTKQLECTHDMDTDLENEEGEGYHATSFMTGAKGSKRHDTELLKREPVSLLEDHSFDTALDAASHFVETERDRLIRIGVLTPFDKVEGFERRVERSSLSNLRKDRVSEEDDTNILAQHSIANVVASMSAFAQARPTTKLVDASQLPKLAPPTREFRRIKNIWKGSISDKDEKQWKKQDRKRNKRRRPLPDKKWRKRHRHQNDDVVDYDNVLEGSDGDISVQDVRLEGGLRIPYNIYDSLFDYQKTGLKWLWELHCQRAGGIIGDEMGLGKTVQVVAFLAALHHSGMYKPSIVVCPVTLLRQWQREVRKWYPLFHVKILHDSAVSNSVKVAKLKQTKTGCSLKETEAEEEEQEDIKELPAKGVRRWDQLLEQVTQSESGLLVTTYEQLRILRENLLAVHWGYAILDEGHRIRNPDAETTLVCKQLQTVHRIIMSGAPIQNKLTELWSLFDFVFPGKLGVLPVFQAQFALPIAVGGYANATPLQVTTAYKCAVILRDLIMPYLLRRMKSDVYAQLPKKTEHVLFCSLTEEQRSAYRAFLGSSEVEQIFEGSRNSLYGIDILRKICNHPDLLEREHSANHPDYGNPERSGKLKVLTQVLDLWKSQGHRALVFTQTQQMLDIIEKFLVAKGFIYRRLDGSTPIKQRMDLIDEFNESTHVFVLILTTKVGGLGTNLVGANRVIIFDPDWNPSTDMQARERAWRIGQTRDVTIYRLITRGTIEEKVYHRQIYKHFLTNKVLKDPQQHRFFKARDMRDLFTLQDEKHEDKTETLTIFAEVAGEIDLVDERRKRDDDKDHSSPILKVKRLKNKAKFADEVQGMQHFNKGKEKQQAADEKLQEESRILKSLFEANGIHSAINHDAIESMNNSERMLIDNEAARVAQRAVEALIESRMLRNSKSVALPTWTGRSGAAGAPTTVRRRFGSTVNSRLVSSPTPVGSQVRSDTASTSRSFTVGFSGGSVGKALSSRDVFARLRESQIIAAGAGMGMDFPTNGLGVSSSRADGKGPVMGAIQPEILKQQLCSFLELNNGCVSSAYIVEHCKDVISAQDVPLFRQLLKETAILKKEGGEARWVLKDEYRSHQQ